MKLKKYIIAFSVFLLSVIEAIPAFGCAGEVFRPYSHQPYYIISPLKTSYGGSQKAKDETISFWKEYTGGNVDAKEIEDYFKFATADDPYPDGNDSFIRYLASHKDETALEYIADCLQFNALADQYEGSGWDYTERDPRHLQEFYSIIEKRKGGKAFSQRYALLKMRIAGLLRDDEKVMKIWNSVGKKLSSSPLRDRMGGFVGGVLYREKKYPEALDYFYASGDNNSINWCVSKIAGADNLRQLYDHNPNSTATLYVLQDYMNYLISLTEGGRNLKEPQGYYMDNVEEIFKNVISQRNDFIGLCDFAIADPKCENPLAWADAKAAIQITLGDYAAALATLKNSRNLKGTDAMKRAADQINIWALLHGSGNGDEAADRQFTEELTKLYESAEKEAREHYRNFDTVQNYNYDEEESQSTEFPRPNSSYDFLTTFLAEEAYNHYIAMKRPELALAFLALCDNLPVSGRNGELAKKIRNDIFYNFSDADAAKAHGFFTSPSSAHIDKYLGNFASAYTDLANEAYGSRFLANGEFEKALGILRDINPKWLPSQEIAPYLSRYGYYYDDYDFSLKRKYSYWTPASRNNVKAQFCADMIADMNKYKNASGNERAKIAYRIAGRFHDASPKGRSWAISNYSWSTYSLPSNFNREADKWLDRALSDATDPNLLTRIYYGILSSPTQIDGETAYPFDNARKEGSKRLYYFWDHKTDRYLRAANYLRNNMSVADEYIQKCDVLRDYAANRFIQKPSYGWY